jgi:hypothetical protein
MNQAERELAAARVIFVVIACARRWPAGDPALPGLAMERLQTNFPYLKDFRPLPYPVAPCQ